jgi:voltage-gated potassium channel
MSLRDDLIALGIRLPELPNLNLEQWATRLAASPCRNTVAMVGLSTVLFYLCEKNHNPKVNDVWDSMVYCSTCLSVGYSDIFAKTPLGKIVGSALMTIGPSMAAKTTDGPEDKRREEVQEQVLSTLRAILARLEEDSQGRDARATS